MKTSFLLLASLLVAACSGSSSSDVLAPDTSTQKNDPTESTTSNPPTSNPPTKSEDPKKEDPKKDDPPVTTSPPATPSDCDAFAAKFCPKATACNHLVSKLLGTECVDRIAGICKAHLGSPGTGFTQTALTACATAYTTMTCDEAFGDVQPAACNFKGTLTTNTACAFDDQCASGSCAGNDNDSCGTCQPKVTTSNAPKAKLGETCDNSGQSAPQCNTALGLWCDASKKCADIPLASLGQACGFVGQDLVLCNAGLACKYGSAGSGTCIATKPLGTACTKPNGFDDCTFGTSCIAGTCAYPTAAAICK